MRYSDEGKPQSVRRVGVTAASNTATHILHKVRFEGCYIMSAGSRVEDPVASAMLRNNPVDQSKIQNRRWDQT
jgi:hypothetical protein